MISFQFYILDAQLFFLTIAKKNKTRIARVIADDKISIIGRSPSKKISSIDSNNNWTAKREKAIAANIIFFRPVLLYAKIDNANKRREKTPIIAWIALSTPSNNSVCRNNPENGSINSDDSSMDIFPPPIIIISIYFPSQKKIEKFQLIYHSIFPRLQDSSFALVLLCIWMKPFYRVIGISYICLL
jgi:hypothetical protein